MLEAILVIWFIGALAFLFFHMVNSNDGMHILVSVLVSPFWPVVYLMIVIRYLQNVWNPR